MRDYSPNATPGMYEEFMKTVIYNDFQGELAVRIEDARDMLEEDESNLQVTHASVRGLIACLRQMQNIFTDLMINSREDLERKEADDNDS
jgi:hypothetical protein